MKNIWESFKPHAIAMGIFLVVFAAYFHPQLNDKVVEQKDILQGMGMKKEAIDYKERTGEYTLWTNAMFGGMPMYQVSAPQPSNLIRRVVDPITRLFIKAPISMFFVAAMCFYILMLVLDVNRWIAIIGGLAFSLTTNNIVLFAEGHTSKTKALSYIPLALAGVYLLLQKKEYLKGGVVFMLAMSLNIMANHFQMTYYFGIGMIFFMLAYLPFASIKGEIVPFFKSGAVLLVAGLLAVGPSFSKIYTTMEYAESTMRGDSDLKRERRAEQEKLGTSEEGATGLAWDYAMMWSYEPIDLLGTMIPGVAGGSSGEKISSDYEIAKYYPKSRKAIRAPLYWGGADSTAGPAYFGVVVCLLLVIGLFMMPNTGWKIGLIVAMLIITFLSMGRYFEAFNRLFFEHFPKYYSFRAHSSAIGVVAAFFPIIAMVGMALFLNSDKSASEKQRILLISVGIVGGISLIVALMGGSLFSMTHFKDEVFLVQYFNNDQARYDQFMDALQDSRVQYMQSSAWKAVLFVLLAAAVLWMSIKAKLKKEYVIIGLGALILIDLVSTDQKYLSSEEFISRKKQERPFTMRPVDQQIIQAEPNGRGYYRVLDLSIPTFSSASASYFHNTVGGYSAVKMSRIQDVIDTMFAGNISQQVLDMFNTKYIVTQQMKLFPNQTALGTAWYVDSFERVETATDELQSLRTFNPGSTAIIHTEDFKDYTADLKNQAPSGNRSIDLTQYEPNRLVYKSNSPNDGFAVFSEVWYGPDKGWKVYVDGDEQEHIRVNYLLRGMKVPSGEHEIVFEFKPQTYATGERVSMISSILILLLLGGWLFKEIKPYL
ncbi:MAG: YfhO family protein [Bacteroidia bacterium]|nr:YfhO family protein [Bacteroidia bacterium]